MVKLGIILGLLASPVWAGWPQVSAQRLQIQFYGQPDETDSVPPPPGVEAEDWSGEAPPPRPARVCRKMCADDFSPCDPIYFKTEDGRCDGVHFSR
jgi:hypothetical protein